MELEALATHSVGTSNTGSDMTDIMVVDLESFVHVELDMENNGISEVGNNVSGLNEALFLNEEEEDEDESGDDSGTDHFNSEKSGTRLQRSERPAGGNSNVPDTFQTSHLLFYERFRAYQDYMLGDCKPSEVKAFAADYLEKVVEPCDWLALWSTDVFDVLVEVRDVDFKDLKACVRLVLPLQCDTRGCDLTEEAMKVLLGDSGDKVPLQQLQVVYVLSGDFDQTALAVEHLRFFYDHIWRQWDEEDEDDFDYFVRCVEPRLRLYYDILEDRVPAGLVAEYRSLLQSCSQCFQQFTVLRSGLSTDSDSELDNVSMVEGLQLYDQLETLRRKLHIFENPLLRYVLGYKGTSPSSVCRAGGPALRTSCSSMQLQSLLSDRLLPLCCSEDTEIQFHRDPLSAVEVCRGGRVLVLPGVYTVSRSIFLPDSITIEGFGLPDEVVIEKKNKGDSFVESTGANVSLSNIKFIQHDAIEGILCVHHRGDRAELCRLTMNMCDLYGSKVRAGVEIYPGSVCSLVGNGIHHCKDGILIKDFADELDVMPSITMENNVIHNNEGYGVILVKANSGEQQGVPADPSEDEPAGPADSQPGGSAALLSSSSSAQSESTEARPDSESSGTDAASSSGRKWHFNRQLSRSKEPSGNQFRRNGMGDFGTFFY
ncbi:hypothetical protein KUCAC02_001375 [Chaenocephalus aceratus]|uniref:Uncharacterized protein n=1 Tax=Chaenocephalus aceratus TaxID=36190 RepID=A0ACB9XRD8_CHAAC|nr:hypothetical protein KUCAC02_001375 [Chaenocephalus aceratus]